MWIAVLLGIIFLILAVIMLSGKGANLVSGFNTMPKAEKDKYDQKALSRFMGAIMLIIAMLTTPLGYFAERGANWYAIVFIGGVVALVVFAIVYSNTGNRFKK
ncbi:MAG: DUF3784 domain-containing protein [Clostridiales bacterium]|jgi:uncharacterized membrane protein|nr:DUF3784 domain-containing protein [Clostridiales bacterium]